MTIPAIPITDLTTSTLDGSGIFDVLMKTTRIHLDSEFQKNRIKGTEYATVYLGSLESVMRNSLEFLLQRNKIALEAEIMSKQLLIAEAEVLKANAQVALAEAEVEKTLIEKEILFLSKDKVPAEIAHLQAQTSMVEQQTLNLVAEKAGTEAKTALTTQQVTNAGVEKLVLEATKCKLDGEFDVLQEQTLKLAQETALLAQKVTTERAQVSGVGVDSDSVIGKQKNLYQAQTDGFTRDAEQKAAKLMVDSWNVRRTTDEGTVADGTNMLADSVVGRAVSKMLQGVGA